MGLQEILVKNFQKIKDYYKKHFFKTPLTLLVYFVLNGVVSLESRIKRFTFPDVYLRVWKLDMLRGRYEKSTTLFFKKIIQPGMTVIDIGAHIGYFTRLFAAAVGPSGHVYAFEPDPSNFALLKQNTAYLANTQIYQLAVSDQMGQIDFFHSELKTGCHSTIPSPLRQTKIIVSADVLDKFVDKQKIDQVDVIKMDIEGGEPAALRGMEKIIAKNLQMQIVAEFNPECFKEANIEPSSFLRQLADLGFNIYAIRSDGLDAVEINQPLEQVLRGQSFVNILCRREGRV